MNNLKSFCKDNKPSAIVILAFILLGVVFNGKLLNLNHQEAQVISVGSGTSIPYNQYPSLSNSGFYLETVINNGDYYQALVGTRLIMTDTATDIKSLVTDYYASSCVSNSSDACSNKRIKILNSLYTYASYATAYNKISYESIHGVINNNNIDWAGISSASVYASLFKPFIKRTPPVDTIDNLLADISSNIKNTSDRSIVSGSYTYTSPTALDTIQSLSSFLKTKQSTLQPAIALFNKEKNLASVRSVLESSPTAVNTFTINGTTGLIVNQGSALTISWNIANTSLCYAMGGAGTSWTKNSNGVTSSVLPVPSSGIINTTMGSSVSQTFTLVCGVLSGSSLINISKSVTVGVNPYKAVQATSVSNIQTTQTITTTPSPTTQNTTITPSGTSSEAVALSGSVVTTGDLVGLLSTSVTPVTSTTPISSGRNNPIVMTNSTPTTPFVGPLPPSTYNNPYLFVFAPNESGNIDFKILNKSSSADASLRFGQVNGSLGEISATKVNLAEIGNRVSADKLAAANFSATIDNAIIQPTACDPNVGNYSSAAGASIASVQVGTDCSNLKMVEVTTAQELGVLNKKVSFFNTDLKTSYDGVTGSLLSDGNTLELFFGKVKNDQSVGSVSKFYLQNNIISNSETCSSVVSVRKPVVVSDWINDLGKTPNLDKMTHGICGILAVAQSLNYTLKANFSSGGGVGSPTYYSNNDKKVYWNRNYLELLFKNSQLKPSPKGITPSDYIKIYSNNISGNISVTNFGQKSPSYPSFSWGFIPIDNSSQQKLLNLLSAGKTDCELITTGHVSQINKVYFKDNNFFIEVKDGLYQGSSNSLFFGSKYVDVPVKTGLTTFKLDPNGNIIGITNTGVSNEIVEYWKNPKTTKAFSIYCYTLDSK